MSPYSAGLSMLPGRHAYEYTPDLQANQGSPSPLTKLREIVSWEK